MEWQIIHIAETDSTNSWLKRNPETPGHTAVWADYQTEGHGQATNRWESESGRNLTFSMLLKPAGIAASRQFHLSEAISMAICLAVGQHIGKLSIKWPNDIYWQNAKLGGILIENTLQGGNIRESIIGVGLNVNQRTFRSNAPNPVSMWQICEHDTDRQQLLTDILGNFDSLLGRDLHGQYMDMLFRNRGYHPFADADGAFMARIAGVADDGHLLLSDDAGRERKYAFKEVQFVI